MNVAEALHTDLTLKDRHGILLCDLSLNVGDLASAFVQYRLGGTGVTMQYIGFAETHREEAFTRHRCEETSLTLNASVHINSSFFVCYFCFLCICCFCLL